MVTHSRPSVAIAPALTLLTIPFPILDTLLEQAFQGPKTQDLGQNQNAADIPGWGEGTLLSTTFIDSLATTLYHAHPRLRATIRSVRLRVVDRLRQDFAAWKTGPYTRKRRFEFTTHVYKHIASGCALNDCPTLFHYTLHVNRNSVDTLATSHNKFHCCLKMCWNCNRNVDGLAFSLNSRMIEENDRRNTDLLML